VLDKLVCLQGRFPDIAGPHDWYMALAYTVRDRMLERGASTVRTCAASDVILKAAVAEGAWRITVSDNGMGISPGNAARIFDPFFTTRREEGGTGMGLVIVRNALRAHGGEIRLVEARTATIRCWARSSGWECWETAGRF
jgi:signal transduction histidine kinase